MTIKTLPDIEFSRCIAKIYVRSLSYFIFGVINENGQVIDNYENYVGIFIFVTAAFAAVWLAVLYSFRLQQEVFCLQEERLQRSVLENQILQMQNAMTEMERFYEGMRNIRHDMKNQMAVFEKLLKETSTAGNAEVAPFFEDMQKNLMQMEQKIHTGNAVSDAVIGSKFHYAKKELAGIVLDAEDFILTDRVRVRAYDIGVILNNGLDNAIEACKRLRLKNPDSEVHVKIKSFWRQRMFFIEMANSFDGELEWGEDGLPRSVKEDGLLHGIGLKNIRYCARKYKGELECMVQDGEFILSVMLVSLDENP